MEKELKKTLTVYIAGFVVSVILTLAAYFAVQAHLGSGHRVFSHETLAAIILALAVVQLTVQMFSFLHLGSEAGPRWKLAAFLSTIGLIFIIVVGSIWIMGHLNYNMTPDQVDQYLENAQGGF